MASRRPIAHPRLSNQRTASPVASSSSASSQAFGPDQPSPERLGRPSLGLYSLLQATAARHGERPAFVDQSNREASTQRPRLAWTYGLANDVVPRLAAFFRSFALRMGDPVAVCLPGGSEVCLAILAIEMAGLTPCLLPVTWSEHDLSSALEIAGCQAVVTQGVLGEDRPAELLCRVAARRYGLRFICAFGPHVPDGVFDLDEVMLGGEPADRTLPDARGPQADAGFVTYAGPAPPLALRRSARSLLASSATYLAETAIEPGDRIVSLLAPDDHAGLATGPAAALVGGATLELHGSFDGPSLVDALRRPGRTHLVAPGWLEPALAASNVSSCLASTILVHSAPVRFRAKTLLKENTVDVLALGEVALIAKARDPKGRVALSLTTAHQGGPAGALLKVCRDEDGAILVAGLAAEISVLTRSGAQVLPQQREWRDTGFKADVFAGMLIGVS